MVAARLDSRPRDGIALACIVLAGATRLCAALALGNRFHFVDEAIYVDAARGLLAGTGFAPTYRNVPGQPVLLALLAVPWPESIVLLRVAHALVVGIGGGLVLYALGRRLVGSNATRVALVFYALDPLLVVAGGLLYPEASATVVLAGALLAGIVAAQEDAVRATLASGVLLGITALFRPVAIVLAPLLSLWIPIMASTLARRRLVHALVLVFAVGIGVAPWALQNLAQHGDVVPVGMAGLQNALVSKGEIRDRGLAASLAHEAWAEPATVATRVVRELGHFWEPYPTRLATDQIEGRSRLHGLDTRLPEEASFPRGLRDTVSALSFGVEMALALIGIAVAGRTRRPIVLLLVGVALVYGLGYALFVAKLRYRIVVLPGLFLLAGLGAVAAWERFGVRAIDVATAEPRN